MSFPDHHNFTEQDIDAIRTRAAGRTILTTEKDATRLHGLENVKVIPIEVEFLDGKGEEFDQIIKHFVTQTFSPKAYIKPIHNNYGNRNINPWRVWTHQAFDSEHRTDRTLKPNTVWATIVPC